MAVKLVDRLAILLAAIRRFPNLGAGDNSSLRYESYTRMKEFIRQSTYGLLRRFLGDLRREFMQRLSVVLHGTLDSYTRDALHEGGAATVACLHAPRS
jgi:hypothetical protein